MMGLRGAPVPRLAAYRIEVIFNSSLEEVGNQGKTPTFKLPTSAEARPALKISLRLKNSRFGSNGKSSLHNIF